MSKLALIQGDNIIAEYFPGSWFDLPDGSRVSPAQDGWSDGDCRLAEIQPADPVPEGKRIVSTAAQMIDDQPKYVHVLADEPLTPLTDRQLRLGLVGGGIMPADVDAAIAAIEDDTARALAQIEWECASQFERDHPLIAQVGDALGLTPEQIDAMWQAALTL